MTGIISSSRTLGRITGASDRLLMKHNLAVKTPGADTFSILMGLANRLPEPDKSHALRLALAIPGLRKDHEGNALNEEISKKEFRQGKLEADYIFDHFPADFTQQILSDHDFLPAMEQARQLEKRRRRRNRFIWGSVVAAVILFLVIYNLPYFAESRMYERVEKVFERGQEGRYQTMVDSYLESYPRGRHLDDVLILPVRAYNASHDIDNTLDAVDQMMSHSPGGRFVAEAKHIYDSIWNAEIERYARIAASKATPAGTDYILGMLQYMKKHNIRTVALSGEPRLSLKEYEEYPEKSKILTEYMFNSAPTWNLQLPDDLIPIKDKVTLEEARSWLDMIFSSLQTGFDAVLTPGFIRFVLSKDLTDEEKTECPSVNLDYLVETNEVIFGGISMPDIWIQKQVEENGLKVPVCLLLGTQMTFKADFHIPEGGADYTVDFKGNGGTDSIQGDKSIFYQTICKRCTEQFVDKITAEFGI